MKKVHFVIPYIIILTIIITGCGSKLSENNIAAIVNDEYIYYDELINVIENSDGIAYETVLTNTISDLLMIQYGRSNGIDVTDSEVDERYNEVLFLYPEIKSDIERGIGISKYKENLRKQMLLAKIRDYYISEHKEEVAVSEEEITEWYEKNISGNNVSSDVIRENVKEVIFKQKEEILFSELIENLKEKANITILQEGKK